jgi:hypothetical protein
MKWNRPTDLPEPRDKKVIGVLNISGMPCLVTYDQGRWLRCSKKGKKWNTAKIRCWTDIPTSKEVEIDAIGTLLQAESVSMV